MKYYAISGLGADKRVFDFLTLNCELIHLDWIDPLKNETIESYGKRLSQAIKTDEEYGLIGVSFGGIVAVEISKMLNPKSTILISSAATKEELRPVVNIFGKTRIAKILPLSFYNLPRFIAHY